MLVQQSIKGQDTMRTSTTRFTFGSSKVWREISKNSESTSLFSSSTDQHHLNKASNKQRTRTSSNSSMSSNEDDECPRATYGCPRTTRIHAQRFDLDDRSIFPDVNDGVMYTWMQQQSSSSESNIQTDSLDAIIRSI
jgi:hypothetical protein